MYVNPQNWVPFAPNGFAGIMGGAAIVFFAFIGFDAVSSTAEETKKQSSIDELKKLMVADEIKKLFDLYKAGALTKQEYEAQKKKLLERL